MDISVITPFYKGNAYMEGLFRCVRQNALAAPELKIELLLINDSPNCPIEYEQAWVHGFHLRILNNPENVGIHRARVNGLAQAQGTFIQFLDQDDLLADNCFSTQFPLAQNTDVVIANGFDQNPKTYGPIYKSTAHQQHATHARFYFSVGNQIVSPGQCLIRKDAIPSQWCDAFIQRNGSDDLLLWLLMFAEDRRFTVNPLLLYTHVDTGINVSADDRKILSSSWEVLEHLKDHGKITATQARKFTRCRRMANLYANKSKFHKCLAMALYPDVAWEKLTLMRSRKKQN